jgi:hypothetical protein
MTASLFLAASIFAMGIRGEQPRDCFNPTFFRRRILQENVALNHSQERSLQRQRVSCGRASAWPGIWIDVALFTICSACIFSKGRGQ